MSWTARASAARLRQSSGAEKVAEFKLRALERD